MSQTVPRPCLPTGREKHPEPPSDFFSRPYQGSVGYLTSERREQVLAWLKQQQTWNLAELMTCVRDTCGVVYQSKQSYYDLFAQAGISWKKSQKRNPRRDPLKVRARREEIKKKSFIIGHRSC